MSAPPSRAAPPPYGMEDAIVAQVEWYLGRVNLETDSYLKTRMDPDLWVDLAVILDFPKMQRMRVRDVAHVAQLLASRSTIVEVDLATARIRPAWARRSTLIISDVPVTARAEDVVALLAEDRVPPPGLLSIQPAKEGVWLAVFDTPTGAHSVLPMVADASIKGVQIRAEVHAEKIALRMQARQAQHQQQQQQPYPRAQPQGVYVHPNDATAPAYASLNHMLMPMPVIHGAAHDVHAQYGYGPYVPQYAPHAVGVPRQFIPPRGMPAPQQSYMMPYPQGGHPFDPSQMAVPTPMQGQMPTAPHAMDGGAAGIKTSTAQGLSEVGRPVQAQPQAKPAAGSAMVGGGGGESGGTVVTDAEGGSREKALPPQQMVPVEAPRFVPGPMPVSAQMAVPVITAQPVDPSQIMPMPMREQDSIGHGASGKGPMDPHYMHRGAVIGDPNVAPVGPGSMSGVNVRGSGRGQHQHQHQHQGGAHRGDRNTQRSSGDGNRGTPRGSGGNGMDVGRGTANRKGKKGNRNNSGRHNHHGDRHGDGRNNDGKIDASGAPSNRDDRKVVREEKPKPEPNLNSMHFPPLPLASDSFSPRNSQSSASNKSSMGKKDVVAESNTGVKHLGSGSEANGATRATSSVGTENEETNSKIDSNDTGSSDTLTSSITDQREPTGPKESQEAHDNATNTTGSTESGVEETKEPKKVTVDKSGAEHTAIATAPNGSAMSYAAILRSRKPAPPRPPPQPQRGTNAASGKSNNNHGSAEAPNAGSVQGGKDRNSRRRKVGHTKNSASTDSNKDNEKSTNYPVSGDVVSNKSVNGSSINGEVKEVAGNYSDRKTKVTTEATRAHSVWANKPKSLFQAASATPLTRAGPNVEGQKMASPSSSQNVDTVREKGSKDTNSPKVIANGGSDLQSPVQDASTNGGDLPAIHQLALDKGRNSSQPGETNVSSTKKNSGSTNGNQVAAKGAWASGGPKAWPKSGGNGVMEKATSASDS